MDSFSGNYKSIVYLLGMQSDIHEPVYKQSSTTNQGCFPKSIIILSSLLYLRSFIN